MSQSIDSVSKALETEKRSTKAGGEYWMGRDLQLVLGYSTWENFEKVIEKASKACESAGGDPNDHFRETTKMMAAGKGALVPRRDYFLDRYACYLIAMNGETSKAEVGIAQTYFAVQTRRQEIQSQLSGEERRLQLRERVRMANRSLASTAKQAGVQKFAVFQAAGYAGLYEMGLPEIRRRKGLKPKEDILDRAGRTELAANEFRITQTDEKLSRDQVRTERDAIETHKKVGAEVRSAIRKLGGTMPEHLAAEPSIKAIAKKLVKGQKALPPPMD